MWRAFPDISPHYLCSSCFHLFVFLWFFLALVLSSGAHAQVLINEIYYDHPGADAGHEFVELINTGSETLGLKGFSLEFHNGSSVGWAVIWYGSVYDSIRPGRLFTLGGMYVQPRPDTLLALHLQNGPDAVRLVRSGAQADVVGYGNLDDPSSYEGESAQDVQPGYSLGRKPDGADTDNNRLDFSMMTPSPGLLNVPLKDLRLRPSRKIERTIETGLLAFPFFLMNKGLVAVEAGTFTIEIWDSTAYTTELLDTLSNSTALEPGDSVAFQPLLSLSDGYHWISARLRFPGDERSHNDSFTLIIRAGNPGLLISEVMSYPNEGCPQYIEIFNSGFETIDLSGWYIRDAAHSPALIAGYSFVVAPLEYAVLTADRGELLSRFSSLYAGSVLEIEGSWPYLNHTGTSAFADSIVLADGFGLVVDRVAYPPQPVETRGKSLERADIYPGFRPHIWALSSQASGGTPGCENGITLRGRPLGIRIHVHPNPFWPYKNEMLVIEVPASRNVEKVVMTVYDVNGCRIKEVGSATSLPSVFLWDGKTAAGITVEPGIYILTCEAYSGGGRKSVQKVVVGCGRRIR